MKKKFKTVVIDHPKEYGRKPDWSRLYEITDVTMYHETAQDNVAVRIGDADIVMINKARITKEIIDSCPNLKYISAIATGYNIIDTDYAAEKGIPVSNVPSYGSAAIAQHAIALLLETTNHVGDLDKEVKKGRKSSETDWCFWDRPIIELDGKTIGIVGAGRIGKQVAAMASGLGMNVIAYDVYPSSVSGVIEYVSFEELLSRSDVISLHCPLSEDKIGMINKNTIAKMKDGVILINNSRGGLINERDVADALTSGKMFACGLDTVPEEPIPLSSPLLTAPNCYITPHISWAAFECRDRLVRAAIANVESFIGGAPLNVVNM